jgi:hypothetical protein
MPDPARPQTPPRRPDAIRCPRDFPRDPRTDRDVARNRLFGPVFGCRRVWNRELTDRRNESFVTPRNGPDPGADSMFHPSGHPLAGEHRHEWWVAEVRKDGTIVPLIPESGDPGEAGKVKVGYLTDDPYADDEATQAAIRDAFEEKVRAYRASPEYLDRMRALGVEPVQAPGVDPVPDPARPAPAVLPGPARGAGPSTPPSHTPVPEPEK